MASEDLRRKEEELKQHQPTTFKGELASKNDKTHNRLPRMILSFGETRTGPGWVSEAFIDSRT